MQKFVNTQEQENILTAGRSDANLMVHALAGTGKTTTLGLLGGVLPSKPSAALAFNVKIKKALERIFPSHFEVMTLNGMGHRAWGRAVGKRLELDERKVNRLAMKVMKEMGSGENLDYERLQNVVRAVRAAQGAGLVPVQWDGSRSKSLVPDTEDGWLTLLLDNFVELAGEADLEAARRVLALAIGEAYAGTISYDDQIYMSALFGGIFGRYHVVMADECQDLSPLNHMQIAKMKADRLILVGDEHQAIYAFRGASGDSMSLMRKLRPEESWVDLPLATTFRCPRRIVQRQLAHVGHFVAAKANPEGKIVSWSSRSPAEPGRLWNHEDVVAEGPPGAAVAYLSRNNAPLIRIAFRLIADHIGCSMLGRDIGKNLIALSKKVLADDAMPMVECVREVNQWAQNQIDLAHANGREGTINGIQDRRDCLLAVLESDFRGACQDAADLRKRIAAIFESEDSRVILATGHRAKGLEWPLVVHLDPWRIPSRHAKTAMAAGNPVPLTQEKNLRYVIETRTMHTYVEVDAERYESRAARAAAVAATAPSDVEQKA